MFNGLSRRGEKRNFHTTGKQVCSWGKSTKSIVSPPQKLQKTPRTISASLRQSRRRKRLKLISFQQTRNDILIRRRCSCLVFAFVGVRLENYGTVSTGNRLFSAIMLFLLLWSYVVRGLCVWFHFKLTENENFFLLLSSSSHFLRLSY